MPGLAFLFFGGAALAKRVPATIPASKRALHAEPVLGAAPTEKQKHSHLP
jgi:hypothetical protein